MSPLCRELRREPQREPPSGTAGNCGEETALDQAVRLGTAAGTDRNRIGNSEGSLRKDPRFPAHEMTTHIVADQAFSLCGHVRPPIDMTTAGGATVPERQQARTSYEMRACGCGCS